MLWHPMPQLPLLLTTKSSLTLTATKSVRRNVRTLKQLFSRNRIRFQCRLKN